MNESKKFVGVHDNAKRNDTFFEWWQAFDLQYFRHSIPWTIIVVLAYLFILVAGLVGNSLVILAYIFRPKMRSVTNLFIMNLAVADLLAVIFCFLGNLLSNTIRPWILGLFMCKAVAVVQGVSVGASAYFLAAISVDRCIAIRRPLGRPQGLHRGQATYAVIIIWVLALCFSMPWAFTLTIVYDDGLAYCVELWEKRIYGTIYYIAVNGLIYYLLPLIVIVSTNVIIWQKIKLRQVPSEIASASPIRRMHHSTRYGVRKMLGIVTVVFLLSWLPLHVFLIRYRCFNLTEYERSLLHVILPLSQYIGSSNSSINPLLYAYLNSKFRDAFQSFLPCSRSFRRNKEPRPINSEPIEDICLG